MSTLPKRPYLIDILDRELMGVLRKDGRASISKLADILGVSRGTIQNRLDRLVSSGAISGFTIRAHEELETNVVKAIMMIEVVGKSTTQAISKLRSIPQLERLHTTNGAWDLVAEIKTQNLSEFDSVLRDVRSIDYVASSETSILLTSV